MLAIADHIVEDAKEVFELACQEKLPESYKDIQAIIVCGMGGSAICGNVLQSLLIHDSPVPVLVNKSPSLPGWVNESTLVVCVSYSGNTYETLTCFQSALEKNAKIMGLTTGGQLEQLFKTNDLPHVKFSGGKPPRTALFELLFGLLGLFIEHPVLNINQTVINNTLQFLSQLPQKWSIKLNKSEKNFPLILASVLQDSFPLLWGVTHFTDSVALRWKNQLSENSKVLSQFNVFPELTHNEIVNMTGRNYEDGIIMMFPAPSELASQRVNNQIEIALELIQPFVKDIIHLPLEGDNFFESRLFLIYLGDYVSIYLALLEGIDPTEIDAIISLKERMTLLND